MYIYPSGVSIIKYIVRLHISKRHLNAACKTIVYKLYRSDVLTICGITARSVPLVLFALFLSQDFVKLTYLSRRYQLSQLPWTCVQFRARRVQDTSMFLKVVLISVVRFVSTSCCLYNVNILLGRIGLNSYLRLC